MIPAPGHTAYATPHRAVEDAADLFTPAPITHPAAPTQPTSRNAQIVVVWGGSGGVGKSSMAQALAATAAHLGVKTVLIDANVGQGDQRLRMGIPVRVPLPSIYNAAVTGDPLQAVTPPDQLAAVRPNHNVQPGFALAAAPPHSYADDARLTPQVYLDVVRAMSRTASLVIIDTQIVEARSQDMFTGLVLPLMLGGAWGLGVGSESVTSVSHLIDRLSHFHELGVPATRQMYVMNKLGVDVRIDLGALQSRLSPFAQSIGVIHADPTVVAMANAGELLIGVPSMAHQVETILNHVVQTPVTTKPWTPGEDTEQRRGLFGRKKARA